LRFTKSKYEGDSKVLTILPTACWHVGHVNYKESIVKEWLDKLDYNHRGLLLGDMAEVATKDSVGKGLFDTNMTPKKQRDYIIELIEEKAEFIDAGIPGNHEERIVNSTSIDLMEDICKAHKIPYLGYQGFIKYAWNGVGYIINMWHGTGTGSSASAAIKQAEDMSERNFADVYLLAHHHKQLKSDRIFTVPDPRNMTIQKIEQHFVVCGSALDYDEGYADMKGLQSRKLGFPTIYLHSDKNKGKKIEVLI
jgi:hypothetical protein